MLFIRKICIRRYLTREPIETVKKAQQLANDLVKRAELLYNSNKVKYKPLEAYQELLAVCQKGGAPYTFEGMRNEDN